MNIKIKHNFACIQIVGEFIDKYKSLYIPSSFNSEKTATIFGRCVAAPEKLLYYKKEIDAIKNEFGGTINAPLDRADEIRDLTARSVMYDVPVELQPDDFVYFKYNVYYDCQRDGRIFKRGGDLFIIIPYEACYVAIRGDEIIPLNGLLLLEPVIEENKSSFILPEKESASVGTIAYMGAKVNGYLQYQDLGSDDDFFSVGDKVLFRKHSAVAFEYFRSLDKKFFKLHRKDLLGKVG